MSMPTDPRVLENALRLQEMVERDHDGERERRGGREDTSRERELKRVGVTPRPPSRWNEWLDGEYHALRKGIDFDVPVERMRTRVHNRAKAKGLVVWTESGEGGTILGIQAFSSQAEKARAKYKAKTQSDWANRDPDKQYGYWIEVDDDGTEHELGK